MITYNTWVLLGLFAVSLAAFKLSKIKDREVRFMMIFMLVFLLLNNLFIFLFDPEYNEVRLPQNILLYRKFQYCSDWRQTRSDLSQK